MNQKTKTFVIVSEDPSLRERVERAAAFGARVEVVESLREASALASSESLVGLVIDGAALVGQPVPQLMALRAKNSLVNVLFLPVELRGSLLNDLQPLRVEILARPLPPGSVERFVRRTLSAGRVADWQVGAWIEHLTTEHRLSGHDVALFPLVLDRETPEALCARLNIDEAALSRGLRRLVKKCRVRNTDRLAKNLMRDALLLSSRPAYSGLSEAPLGA